MSEEKGRSPVQLMIHAIKKEKNNAERLALMAERFRPYNQKLSRVLDEIAEEESLASVKLGQWFEERFGFKPPVDDLGMTCDSEWLDGEEHFFVTDEDASDRLIWRAFKEEMDSYLFFKEASSESCDSRTHDLYQKVADYELDHAQALQYLAG